MSDFDSDAVEVGAYGDVRILPNELENDFEALDANADLKAKVWRNEETGDRRLYLRVRDHDDGRTYDEISVDLPPSTRRRRSNDEVREYLQQLRDHDPRSPDASLLNEGAIGALEWVLSPDEAAMDGVGGEDA